MHKRGLAPASSRWILFLTATFGAALWMPMRGTAQQTTDSSSSAPASSLPSAGSGDSTGSTAPLGTNDNVTNEAVANDTNVANDNVIGNSSSAGGTGSASLVPLVPPRRPAPPANPLVLLDPVHQSGNPAADYYPNGTRKPAATRGNVPEDYTLPSDPGQDPYRRPQQRLPLFGYDFFQPARQIILAHRRALLNRGNASVNNSGGRNNTRNGQLPTGYNRNNPSGTNGQNQYQPALGNTSQFNSAGQSYNANGTYPNDQLPSSDQNAPNSQTNQNPSNQSLTNNQSPSDTGNESLPSDQNTNTTDALSGAAAVGGGFFANGSDSGMSQNSPDQTGTNGTAPEDQNQGNQNQYNAPNGYDAPSDQIGIYNQTRPTLRRNPNNSDTYNSDMYDSSDLGDNSQNLNSINNSDNPSATTNNDTIDALNGEVPDPLTTLKQNIFASLPPNYQLQPGDSLTVRYSTFTVPTREFTTVVDSQGGITIAGVGRVVVAGRTSAEAEDLLRRRLERLYKGVDVSISLRQLRTIQVTVSGAAFAPGTYTVPAAATAFNVLNAAGGPTPDGSLRDIRVLRSGRLVGSLDLYPLLGAVGGRSPGRISDIALQPGDNIYIEARFSRVAVRGEVRQPAIFELTPTEGLRDALAYAGGVKPSGVDQTVHIDTVNRGIGRELRDVNLRSAAQVAATPLYDGDTVEVSSVRAILVNRVTIDGAVDQPGDYALVPGMRVTDLIQRARGPLYNAYLTRADLVRTNLDNTTTLIPIDVEKALDMDSANDLPLARFDRLRLYTRSDVAFLGNRTVTVRGAVQRPGLYTRSDNERVSDLLLAVGGPLKDAYKNRAVLLHQRGDGSFAYDYVNLADILAGGTAEDVPLEDNDVLAVYRIEEAHFQPDHVVTVQGAVVAPGVYPRGDGMRLSDLLKLAGTFRPGGGTRVTVAHARQPGNQMPMLVANRGQEIQVAFNGEGIPTAGEDLTLQDGDVVAVQGDGSIKDHPSVITVTGAVSRPGPIILSGKERLSDAIREAGGLRPEAFPQGAEFTRSAETLTTTGQLNLADVINKISDMLNLTEYQRKRAESNLELIQAAGSAASGSSGGLLASSTSNSSTVNPNTAPLYQTLSTNNLVSQGRILTPSQLQPNGDVAVHLAEALRHPGGHEDVLLKDGDTLVIPETPTTVQVVGAVYNARGVLWRPGQSLDYYVQNAGDFTPDAAKDRIEVIHAGGGLIPASKAGALQPGDLILVPTKVLAEKVSQSGSSFTNLFTALTGSAITYKLLTSVFGL